jgi:hypothetical protein
MNGRAHLMPFGLFLRSTPVLGLVGRSSLRVGYLRPPTTHVIEQSAVVSLDACDLLLQRALGART